MGSVVEVPGFAKPWDPSHPVTMKTLQAFCRKRWGHTTPHTHTKSINHYLKKPLLKKYRAWRGVGRKQNTQRFGRRCYVLRNNKRSESQKRETLLKQYRALRGVGRKQKTQRLFGRKCYVPRNLKKPFHEVT